MRNLKFSIHPLFLIFVFVFVVNGLFVYLLAYILTIFLHEYSHFVFANRLGYRLNKFTLMPHGISLSGKNVLFSFKDEISIALAGPCCNLIIAIIGFAVWWIYPESFVYSNIFIFANLITGLINFLPVFPMDGGRIVLALLSKKYDRIKAYNIIKKIGVIVSFLLVIGFVVTTFFSVNLTFLSLGLFVFFTAISEDKTSVYERTNFLDNKNFNLKHGIVVRELAVTEDTTLYKLVSKIRQDSITNFRVLNKNLKVVGLIEEKDIQKLIQIFPATATVKTILVFKRF